MTGLLLIDAGGQYSGYQTDITRTYPVNGRFSDRQKKIYQAVLAAQLVGERNCRAGVGKRDLSHSITKSLADSLFALNLITEPNSTLVHFFCPHGYSHSVGLDVHDYPPLPNTLVEGNVLTIEPGIYFNRVLLTEAVFSAEPRLVASEIKPYLAGEGFGGVRIEDTYSVERDRCKQLSTAVKSIADVEKMMKR